MSAADGTTTATVPGEGGLPKVVVTHSSGAKLEVYLWGATVTSFKTAAGQELLFVSTKAIFDGKKPIRGGIPVVFPQFATQGPLPQHGFARNSDWTLASVGDGRVELTLADNEETRAAWPHAFALKYTITFDNAHLETSLEVTNPASATEPFSFEALLHTYLFTGTGNATGVRIGGLKGTRYISKPEGGAVKDEEGDAIVIDREVDRVYFDTPVDVTVAGVTSGGAATAAATSAAAAGSDAPFTTITVKRAAFVKQAAPALKQVVAHAPLDVVVWNAWVERARAIADLGDDDYKHYVCVEPGRVSAATAEAEVNKALKPGHAWTLRQTLLLGRE